MFTCRYLGQHNQPDRVCTPYDVINTLTHAVKCQLLCQFLWKASAYCIQLEFRLGHHIIHAGANLLTVVDIMPYQLFNLDSSVERARVGCWRRVWVGATTLNATAYKEEQHPQTRRQ